MYYNSSRGSKIIQAKRQTDRPNEANSRVLQFREGL